MYVLIKIQYIMKSKIIISFCSFVISMVSSVTVLAESTDAPVSGRAMDTCKWEYQNCGLFSGEREICVQTGDGLECTCGSVTREC